jgi:D-alanine--poly(phosphoribitol) ligase subunit 2
VDPSMVEIRIEKFISTQFSVSPTDPGFDREADLFEHGYVDSVGVVELLGFLQEEFSVEVPDDDILTDDFSNIAGIARIVIRNSRLRTGVPGIT